MVDRIKEKLTEISTTAVMCIGAYLMLLLVLIPAGVIIASLFSVARGLAGFATGIMCYVLTGAIFLVEITGLALVVYNTIQKHKNR